MNLLFGTSLILLTIGTVLWATMGPKLAALPLVAFVVGFINGDHNTPKLTETTFDFSIAALVGDEFVRYDAGDTVYLVNGRNIDALPREKDEPAYKPGLLARLINGDFNLPSEQAVIDAPRYKPGLVVEPMLDSFGKPIAGFNVYPKVPTGLRAWLAGGYNMPREVA